MGEIEMECTNSQELCNVEVGHSVQEQEACVRNWNCKLKVSEVYRAHLTYFKKRGAGLEDHISIGKLVTVLMHANRNYFGSFQKDVETLLQEKDALYQAVVNRVLEDFDPNNDILIHTTQDFVTSGNIEMRKEYFRNNYLLDDAIIACHFFRSQEEQKYSNVTTLNLIDVYYNAHGDQKWDRIMPLYRESMGIREFTDQLPPNPVKQRKYQISRQ